MTGRGRALTSIGAGCGIAVLHLATTAATWTMWDAAPAPGQPYPHPMPALWPILSFPAFPLYELLTGGDRAMFDSFWWVMAGNSAAWGIAAGTTLLALLGRRGHAKA